MFTTQFPGNGKHTTRKKSGWGIVYDIDIPGGHLNWIHGEPVPKWDKRTQRENHGSQAWLKKNRRDTR